jgi:hypothetical protein
MGPGRQGSRAIQPQTERGEGGRLATRHTSIDNPNLSVFLDTIIFNTATPLSTLPKFVPRITLQYAGRIS